MGNTPTRGITGFQGLSKVITGQSPARFPLSVKYVFSLSTAGFGNFDIVMAVKRVFARQIIDSRGNPTVEVDVETDKGLFRAAVPSGASTGIHEALELRDNNKEHYLGKGVSRAVDNINSVIGPQLVAKGLSVTDQTGVDNFLLGLDGTENKSSLGANALLGVSLAVCKAGAAAKGVPLYQHIASLAGNDRLVLPVPAFNVLNGGSHAGNKLAFQEFMVLPTSANSFSEAMKIGAEVYQHLKAVVKAKHGLAATAVGDEGGLAPNLSSPSEAMSLVQEAVARAGYAGQVEVAMDVAASEFYRDSLYDLDFKNEKSTRSDWLTSTQLLDLYKNLIKEYGVTSIEDPFDQDDWDSWSAMVAQTDIQVVTDDLTVTNPKRIQTAIERKAGNCLLLKVNQIGTVTEAIGAHKKARAAGWGTMVSHRSGETEDTFIADLAVGLAAGQIKSGAPCRSERLAKYNQLLRIEEELGDKAVYAGKNFRKPI